MIPGTDRLAFDLDAFLTDATEYCSIASSAL
jgi:hypothetical protein